MKVETQKLWDEFRETGDVELRNRLVEKYLYIVKYVADRLQQKLPRSIRNEDLRSAASFGLIRAVEFRPQARHPLRDLLRDTRKGRDPGRVEVAGLGSADDS